MKDWYKHVKESFARVHGVGGVFVPKECEDVIERLEAEGYEIVVYPTAPLVKVLNPDREVM